MSYINWFCVQQLWWGHSLILNPSKGQESAKQTKIRRKMRPRVKKDDSGEEIVGSATMPRVWGGSCQEERHLQGLLWLRLWLSNKFVRDNTFYPFRCERWRWKCWFSRSWRGVRTSRRTWTTSGGYFVNSTIVVVVVVVIVENIKERMDHIWRCGALHNVVVWSILIS